MISAVKAYAFNGHATKHFDLVLDRKEPFDVDPDIRLNYQIGIFTIDIDITANNHIF